MTVGYRRVFVVAHGRDGFQLLIRDEWLPAVIAEHGMDWLLVALGHPCCGKGPLARIKVRFGTLKRLGIQWGQPDEDDDWSLDQDEDAMDLFWFRLMNLPCKAHRRDRPIRDVALTDEEALAIRPDVANWSYVWDRDDEDEDDTEAVSVP